MGKRVKGKTQTLREEKVNLFIETILVSYWSMKGGWCHEEYRSTTHKLYRKKGYNVYEENKGTVWV